MNQVIVIAATLHLSILFLLLARVQANRILPLELHEQALVSIKYDVFQTLKQLCYCQQVEHVQIMVKLLRPVPKH